MTQVINLNLELAIYLPKRNEHYTADDIAEILQEYLEEHQTASFNVISAEVKPTTI